ALGSQPVGRSGVAARCGNALRSVLRACGRVGRPPRSCQPDRSVRASMSAQPLVSVVTPVYNSEAFWRVYMESVLRQTWQTFEYIIVDNESTDATRESANEYAADPRVRVLTP